MKKMMLLVTVLVFLLVGCDKKDPIAIEVYGLNGPTSMGMIKMFEENTTLDKEITVTYENVAQPDVVLGMLLNEEIDIAAVPTNVASVIYNKTGGKYKVAAVNTLGVLYIVTNGDVEINSIEDLKGKTIGASGKGSSPEYVLNYVLSENGIDPENDVTVDYSLAHADLATAVIAGEVEIALLPEPFVTMVTMQSEAKVAISMQDEWEKITGNGLAMGCIVVKTSLADERSDVVDAFLDAYETSVKWVNENPVDASLLIEKYGVLPKAKIAELAISNSNIVFMKKDEMKAQMKSVLDVLYQFNPQSIGGSMPDEAFYY
ncbi:MAG: ABC transporter substrate-binding protein [Clostridia bacterium]|nr:ABC transporter substrate-binding protein [Clostridia bacterium]